MARESTWTNKGIFGALIKSCSGLEADQKVIAAHGCYAMTATAALTAQNTQGVRGIHEIPSEFVRKQIDACIEDIGLDVLKTGTSFHPNSRHELRILRHARIELYGLRRYRCCYKASDSHCNR